MKNFLLLAILLIGVVYTRAQYQFNTPGPIQFGSKVLSTDRSTLNKPLWHISISSESKKHEQYPEGSRVDEIKKRLAAFRNSNRTPQVLINKKTRSNNVVLGKNFDANQLRAHTPSDNSIAISKAGIIVSCDNDQLLYADTNGTILLDKFIWNDFLDSVPSLLYGKYDPRVVYDNNQDRFVVVILHGPANASVNKIIIGFSKTNDPQDGWNIFNITGNPFNDSSWVDFPNIGINKNELFVTVNLFKDATQGYKYNQSVIYQIGLNEGYTNAAAIPYKIWSNVSAQDGYPGFTSVPTQNGWGKLPDHGMHFLNTRIDTGSQLYYYYIDKPLTDTTAQLTSNIYTIPAYNVCADALIKDPVVGNIDSISTGVAWIQSAYEQDSQLHFVFCANIDTGWCGLQYGQLNLKSNSISMNSFGFIGTSICYPAIASMGHNEQDHAMAIMYCQADITTLPSVNAVGIKSNGTYSNPILIKAGDTMVNILPPSFNQPERWGDYSGIQKQYGNTKPEVWLAGSYSGNNDGRTNAFNTWIAQLKSDSIATNVSINDVTTTQQDVKIFPSPAYNEFAVQFETNDYEQVNISLLDAKGALVKQLFNNKLQDGKHTISFNAAVLSTGIYFVQIQVAQNPVISKRLVVQ